MQPGRSARRGGRPLYGVRGKADMLQESYRGAGPATYQGEKRRVVHISPLFFNQRSTLGGGERYPLNITRGLIAAAGGTFTAEVISFDNVPDERPVGPGVTLRLLPAVNRHNPLSVLSLDLPAAIAGADLVHIHQVAMRASETALLVAKQLRKPVCATDHGSTTSSCGVFANRLELADRVVCYSDYGASLLETRAKIEVIKGGVDGDFFCPPRTPLPRGHVLYAGRLVPYKSVDQLIRAMPRDLPLVVCGQPSRPDYFRLLQDLAKGKDVRFILNASDEKIRELYRTAWVTVLPTRYEDCYGNLQAAPELMGLTLLESMACGTPAICFRAGAMPEFVHHGETGFVFDGLDELTAQITYLADNSTAVEVMGRNARRRVEREFDYRVVGAKLAKLYAELMGLRAGKAVAA